MNINMEIPGLKDVIVEKIEELNKKRYIFPFQIYDLVGEVSQSPRN